jgi:methylthioribulose-1-phosphate dehydratase
MIRTRAPVSFAEAADAIVASGRWLDAKGWAPGGGGNYSHRLDDGTLAITASGTHKGRISPADVMRITPDGTPLDPARPSDETLLHCQIYRLYPEANAVLHSHGTASLVLARHTGARALHLAGWELLKAFPGTTTHETAIALPVVANDQDMARLTGVLEPRLLMVPAPPAYLIDGHGAYAWGRSMDEAARVLETVEYLCSIELELVRLRASPSGTPSQPASPPASGARP